MEPASEEELIDMLELETLQEGFLSLCDLNFERHLSLMRFLCSPLIGLPEHLLMSRSKVHSTPKVALEKLNDSLLNEFSLFQKQASPTSLLNYF